MMRKSLICTVVTCLAICFIFIVISDLPNIIIYNGRQQDPPQHQPQDGSFFQVQGQPQVQPDDHQPQDQPQDQAQNHLVGVEQRTDTSRVMQSSVHSSINDKLSKVKQLNKVEVEVGVDFENETSTNECKKRLPTALIIGARKSGTGTLLEFLGLHPHIMRTQNDELTYFHTGYRKGEAWYLSRMPCSSADDVIIEKSPAYFHHEQVPKRVLKQNPEMKLLLIVKDPVRRVVSNYMHDKRKTHKIISPGKVRGRSLESMILTPTGEVKNNSDYIQVSTYHEHLENWYKWFPREQILILDGKLLMEDPSRLLQEVEVFFGLEHKLTSDLFYFDDKKGFFCYKKGEENMCMPKHKGTTPVGISQQLNETLTNYFKPLNEKFFQLVNQTFDW